MGKRRARASKKKAGRSVGAGLGKDERERFAARRKDLADEILSDRSRALLASFSSAVRSPKKVEEIDLERIEVLRQRRLELLGVAGEAEAPFQSSPFKE